MNIYLMTHSRFLILLKTIGLPVCRSCKGILWPGTVVVVTGRSRRRCLDCAKKHNII